MNAESMMSFWENKLAFHYDYVIVGAGIMGCSVAYELRTKYKQSSIAVLERGILPTGASTKNAGFACFGSVTEILSDIDKMGDDAALQLVMERYEGLAILKNRFSAQQLGLTDIGGYELILDRCVDSEQIVALNQKLHSAFKEVVFKDLSKEISDFGFSDKVKQLIRCKQEAQIDSGIAIMSYWNLLRENNIHLITGADVMQHIDDTLLLQNGSRIKGSKIVFCTNAFTSVIDLPLTVKPGRGQVVVTKEIPNLKFNGSFHFEEGFYYFRNIGNRVLFGGGRQLDFSTEETTEFQSNKKILDDLLDKLNSIILYQTPFEIEIHWQGIMAFSSDKKPSIQCVNSYTDYIMACNGMGVALSPLVARKYVESL